MEPIFSIHHGEFFVADYLKKRIKQSSVFIPASSNQKGIDLLLFNIENKKHTTIQVKSARPFFREEIYKINKKEVKTYYHYGFNKYKPHKSADWHIFVCYYPMNTKQKTLKRKESCFQWKEPVVFALNRREYEKEIRPLKNINGKESTRFEISINDNRDIFLTRGLGKGKGKQFNEYKIEKRIDRIQKALGRKTCF